MKSKKEGKKPFCNDLENDLIRQKEESLIFQFHHLHNVMFRVANKMITDSGVPIKMEQIPVLMTLFYFKEQSQKMVADRIGRDKSSVLRTASTLEKKGLLTYKKDKNDGRKKVLALTKTGTFVVTQIVDLIKNIEQEVSMALSNRPKKELLSIIKNAADKLEILANS